MTLRSVIPAFLLDAILILIFIGLGRASHERGNSMLGLLETGWPFLAALAVSWVVSLAWRAPAAPIRTGLPLWIGTLVLGMILRALTGEGTALAFVLVAAGTIGVMLVGWRTLAEIIRRRRPRS